MKWRKLLFGAALAAGGYAAVGNYFYDLAMKREEKFFLKDNPNLPGGTSGTDAEKQERKEAIKKWLLSVPSEEASIVSHDGLKLTGTIFNQEQPSHLWMILVHGYFTNQKAMSDFAYEFYQYGFNILTIDCRASGHSEGTHTTMGWLERLDRSENILRLRKSKRLDSARCVYSDKNVEITFLYKSEAKVGSLLLVKITYQLTTNIRMIRRI